MIHPQSDPDHTTFFFFSSIVSIETLLDLFGSIFTSFPPIPIDITYFCSSDTVIVTWIILHQVVSEVFSRLPSMVEEWFE